METIRELKEICQPSRPQNALSFLNDGVIRALSIHVTRAVLQRGLSCCKIGLASIAAAAAGCLLLLSGSFFVMVIGALLITAWSVLRCTANEISLYEKFHKKTPDGGPHALTAIYFETLLQYTVNMLMPLCLSFGIFMATDESLWLIAGMGTALVQILLLVMHHAQESAILRKFNHERGAHVLRGPSEKPAAGTASKAQKILSALNLAMTYPALGNLLLVFSIASLITGSAGFLKLFLILTAAGSAASSLYTIAKKIKNHDPDKQLTEIASQSR